VVDHLSVHAPTALTGRLAEIVDAVDSGITVQDSDLRLVYANQAAAELCGWGSAADMLDAPVAETLDRFELIDVEGKPLSVSTLPGRRALAGDDPDPVIVGFRIRATGEERWSRVRARPMQVEDGSRYAITTFHDLTDHILAERASVASERRYREIVEALPVFAWFTDPAGVLRASNARWLEYTGVVAASETLDGASQIHPDDRSDFTIRWDSARAATEPLDATVRLRRHDGEYRWHQVRLVPSRGDGGVLHGWIGTATDIDDERQTSQALIDSERQFRDLTNSAPMLVWMAGPDGVRSFFNRGWLDFTGRAIEDETGGGWLEQVHPADRERLAAAATALHAPGDRFELEYRLMRHDGTYRWVLDIGTTRFGPEGEALGHVGSAVDIEERKRASDLARLMADAALRLDEVRSVDEMVDAAAAVAIPAIADWCLIDIVEADGSLRRAAVVADDPTTQGVVDGLRDFPTPAADVGRPAARVVASRQALIFEDLRDEATLDAATAGSRELASRILDSGARSAIVQPLIARGETIGAIFFVVGPERTYTSADLPITAELAGRLALAISNGQISAAEQAARRAAEAATERVSGLQRLTRSLAEASTRESVAELVVREGRTAIGASGAIIMVAREDRFALLGADGYAADTLGVYRSIPLDSTLPIAVAARDNVPLWLEDVKAALAGDDIGREATAHTANASACAVPLQADGVTFGALGLSFATPTTFDDETRSLIGAYADLCSQALTRVALTAIREQLVADLEAERARLEALLQQLPEGLMIAEAPSGRIVLANERLEEILGIPRSELHHIAGGEAYRGFDVSGRELRPEDWPLSRAVKGETVEYAELRLIRMDGSTIWVAKRARPVRDREGRVIAGVATIIDISDVRQARENRLFLSNASEVLSSSLDYEETIRQVAELAVPHIADWCAVDVLDDSGAPQRLAVAHQDPTKIELVTDIQKRYPSDPNAERGVAHVIRTGRPDMMSDIPPELIAAGARDAEHLELLEALELHSYICVPIVDRGVVLGAVTFAAAESGRSFGPNDLNVAESIASRAAAAISNARSYREAVRYKRILDATLDAVVMFDPVTLRISYANQGAADQLGYSIDDLVGEEATVLVKELDAIGIRGLVGPLVRGDLDARTATISFRHKDGRSIPVEVLLQHVAPAGEPARIVAIARDIADRIEAQANLRRLAESEHARAAELNAVIRAMGDGIFVCAADGTITLSNPAAEALFPDVIERTYTDLVAQLDDPNELAPRLGAPGGPVELRTTGDGERWIELSAYPVVRDGDDERAGAETILLLRDVTLARQRQAIRDTFIGVLSHELRTPVTTIFAGAKVLSRETDQLPEATRRDIFSDIVVESERLHRLVEDVIAMTRFQEDEGDVGTEPVLLQRVLPVVVRSEEPRWPGVTFVVDMPSGLPTAVADPTYVEQVVRNLLSNAAKYGGPGTTVKVRVAPAEDDSEVIVSVNDDGPGFPPEEADRIFDLFFRSARTSTAAAGAGIGLFVCARLIRAMGGRIWAEPGPDGGATFTFTLRVMAEED
jgi:PAS domain S-box-containing protein